MALDHRIHDRDDLAELVAAVGSWEPLAAHVAGLHAGDLGWHLRSDAAGFDDTVQSWWYGGRLAAAAIVDGDVGRPRIAPELLGEPEVNAAVADAVDNLAGDQVWSDAQPGSLLRTRLVARGWRLDHDVWTALHLSLQPDDDELAPAVLREAEAVHGVAPTVGDHDVLERVAVQQAAFTHSNFTVDAWHRMAAGPGFDPALDLLARDIDGLPVSAGTAWSAGPGRCGILEPIGIHHAHRDAGHARRLVLAAIAALARAGASGVGVCTPARNVGGIAMYASCGLRPVETLQALTLDRRAP